LRCVVVGVPNFDIRRIFKCLTYAHIEDKLEKKLDPKNIQCMFVGYSKVRKAYSFYNPKNKNIIESIYVIFNEGRLYV